MCIRDRFIALNAGPSNAPPHAMVCALSHAAYLWWFKEARSSDMLMSDLICAFVRARALRSTAACCAGRTGDVSRAGTDLSPDEDSAFAGLSRSSSTIDQRESLKVNEEIPRSSSNPSSDDDDDDDAERCT